ncbi:MAG TPA: HAMP domain-containing sensor histidine kinase [Solirubrobacteraceae bacterium]
MSLRARLILGLLALAAAGLITLAAITYAEQRSFLLQRVDQDARASVNVMSHVLDMCERASAAGVPCSGFFGGAGFGGSVATFPVGTVGQRRDASGAPVETVQISKRLATPNFPGSIPSNDPITVGSAHGSGVNFRVLSEATGDQPGSTIIAIPLTDVSQTLHRLFVVEALVILGILAALAALAWWVVRLGLRPLDRIAETAGAIAAGDLSRRVTPATERTEVGRLGLALNAMLAQIERAFREREASERRLRQFLADASHELRTPLAAIRGYAELFRLGAANDPERAAASMQRIEDEAKRMGDLVENLLMLARLDQVPETTREPVELSSLVADAAEDARVTAPDRQINCEAAGPVTVMGDSGQLRQVVSNLMRNALVHTPAGTPVDLAVSEDANKAVLEVRDYGNGLPAEDSDVLFERFWRADPGRGRGAAGAGLGLSIVRAVVEAHGGHVAAVNAPGRGAVFTVRLPLSPHTPSPPSLAGLPGGAAGVLDS